ncbi:hypothetical protein [Pseudomonas sp. JZ134]|uniref:hypothetical protein n=1 Tax=Pseudomonas sp. JZ134 TaxID=2806615 RepID=UPI003DA0C562
MPNIGQADTAEAKSRSGSCGFSRLRRELFLGKAHLCLEWALQGVGACADAVVTATSIQARRWHIPDDREALIMLLGMVIPGPQRRAALGAAPSPTSGELDRLVDHAVQFFLHGTKVRPA